MRHIMSREHLVDLLAECPRPPIRRAALSGHVECLGLFDRISLDCPHKAWLFVANGVKKRYVVAALLKSRGKIGFRILKQVPWEWYNVDNKRGLAAGDNPIKYMFNKLDAEKEKL